MERVVANAYKLYARTRPAASSESHARAKQLAQRPLAPHPWLGNDAIQRTMRALGPVRF